MAIKISDLTPSISLNADSKLLVSKKISNNKYGTTIITIDNLSSTINDNITKDIDDIKRIEPYISDIQQLNKLKNNVNALQAAINKLSTAIDEIGLTSLNDKSIAQYIDDVAYNSTNNLNTEIANLNQNLNISTDNMVLSINNLNEIATSIALSIQDIEQSNIDSVIANIEQISSNIYNDWENIVPGNNQLSLYQFITQSNYIYNFLCGDYFDSLEDDDMEYIDQYLSSVIQNNTDNIIDSVFYEKTFSSENTNIGAYARSQIIITLDQVENFNPVYITSISKKIENNDIKIVGAYINAINNCVEINVINTSANNSDITINTNILYIRY